MRSTQKDSAGRDVQTIDEITVTGTRLRNLQGEQSSPVTIIDREKIDALGVSTVSEILKYLPQQPYTHGENFYNNGAQFVSLRGLGADTTLVLINGRRSVPSASNIGVNACDVNTIPLAAVERVEVLSDSASAVYGADAVGGVVNIILKRAIVDPQLDLHYGSANGGARERRASIGAGLEHERARMSVVLDYLDKDDLIGGARERWRNQDLTRFGGDDQRSLNAAPGNITSLTGENLPGLPSSFATVPAGSSGVGLTTSDFLATAGQRNNASPLSLSAIQPESKRASAAVFGEWDMTSSLTGFVEALWTDRDTDSQFGPASLDGVIVPATNAFNPFGEDVTANVWLLPLGPRHLTEESSLLRGVAGVRGSLGRWDWEGSVMATREHATSRLENALDANKVATALASVDPATALNPFAATPGISGAALASLVATPQVSDFVSRGAQASLFARGSVFTLPAGDVESVVGGEWRTDAVEFRDFLVVDHDRYSSAGFVEVNVPLISESMQIAGVHSLALKLAGRIDHYDDFGSTVNPQVGLTWTPVTDFLLRASYGTSFRPPSIFELYAPRTAVPLFVNDPRRNNETVDTTALTGGNADLNPVEGASRSAGVVWTPSSIKGLRLAATYWATELNQRVAFFSQDLVLANEARYPQRVVRATPSTADAAAGLPGSIVSVDISRINFGRLDTSGVDLSAAYSIDTAWGRWTTDASATWVRSYDTVELPDTPSQDRIGIARFEGSIPEWRGVASVGWGALGYEISVTGRFTCSYADSADGVTATGRIGAQSLFDIQTSWDSDRAGANLQWLQGLRVSAGVSNVFDKAPPFSLIGYSFGYDSSQGDLRQRFGYINASKRF